MKFFRFVENTYDLQVAKGVTITLNPYEQDPYDLQVYDAFIKLCSRTLVLDKFMAFDLMRRDKNATELDSLRSQLEESITNLQSALNENNNLLARNQNLKVEMNNWKILCAKAERVGKKLSMKADEEIRGLKESLSDMTFSNYGLEGKIEKLLKDLEIAKDNVLAQHELDFQKVLQQAAFFYNIPLNEGKFDVGKDFYQGQLMFIEEILSDREVVSAPPGTLGPERIDVDSYALLFLFLSGHTCLTFYKCVSYFV